MIQAITTPFVNAKPEFVEWLHTQDYPDYEDLLAKALEIVARDGTFRHYTPDPTRIHKIDDGDWQGTLLFVVAADGYQPDTYWFTKVDYGSCSGCDTLDAARGHGGEGDWEPMYLVALHMLQNMNLLQQGGTP